MSEFPDKPKVHSITTGKPLKPVEDRVWLIVLYKARLDQDELVAKAISLVPPSRWDWLSGTDRSELTRSVVSSMLNDIAETEIHKALIDLSDSQIQDERYVEVVTDDAVAGVVFEIMPRAQRWSDGMSEEEIGDRIAAMLSEAVAEMLPE